MLKAVYHTADNLRVNHDINRKMYLNRLRFELLELELVAKRYLVRRSTQEEYLKKLFGNRRSILQFDYDLKVGLLERVLELVRHVKTKLWQLCNSLFQCVSKGRVPSSNLPFRQENKYHFKSPLIRRFQNPNTCYLVLPKR